MSGQDQGIHLLFHGLNWMRTDPIGAPPLPSFPFLFQSPLQISQDPPIPVLLLVAASKYKFLLCDTIHYAQTSCQTLTVLSIYIKKKPQVFANHFSQVEI